MSRLPQDPLLRDYVEEYRLSLESAGRSPATTTAYLYALTDLEDFILGGEYWSIHQPGSTYDPQTAINPALISPLHIERWLADRRRTRSPQNAEFLHRHARPFFRWMVQRGYLDLAHDPFRVVAVPKIPVKVIEVLTDDEVRAVLATTSGSDWRSRRDRALIRVLMDTGIRRGEACGLHVDDVDLTAGVLHVRLTKGRRERLVPLGVKARLEVRVWLRSRAEVIARRGSTDSGALFTGREGQPLSGSGLFQAIQRRLLQAGLKPERSVHVWRHGWATRALTAGAGELDVMVLGGWRSLALVGRYTASNRAERAIAGHARWSPGDAL